MYLAAILIFIFVCTVAGIYFNLKYSRPEIIQEDERIKLPSNHFIKSGRKRFKKYYLGKRLLIIKVITPGDKIKKVAPKENTAYYWRIKGKRYRKIYE